MDWRFAGDRSRDVDLHVETSEPLEVVRGLIAGHGERGFGHDGGIGRGRREIAGAGEDRERAAAGGARRLSLSRGALDPATMREGLRRLERHSGRLGPELSPAGVAPFKRPAPLTRPGATFRPEGAGPFGRMLGGLHRDRPEVVLNALRLTLSFGEAA